MEDTMNKKFCIECKNEIHPLRLEILPNTKTCRFCTKEAKKASRYHFTREGEDIQSSLTFMDAEEYKKVVEIERQYSTIK